MEDVGRLSGGCGKADFRVWEGYLYGGDRLSGWCGVVVWWIREAVWKVWGGCLLGVGSLSGEYGETTLGMLGGCLEGVGKLSEGCGEAWWKVGRLS